MAYRGEYMNPLRFRLEKERERLQINWNIIEQDYVLSWVLISIGLVWATSEVSQGINLVQLIFLISFGIGITIPSSGHYAKDT